MTIYSYLLLLCMVMFVTFFTQKNNILSLMVVLESLMLITLSSVAVSLNYMAGSSMVMILLLCFAAAEAALSLSLLVCFIQVNSSCEMLAMNKILFAKKS
uniref:NADH-ubiquinone oxidoreductase chain 4L n=1 Tax=Albinaria caerulea TaxID=42349 RepID=NU4LM_ALBCA